MSQKCGFQCLGPLTFHPRALGDKIQLSQDNRLAKRFSQFQNGLVFSERPVRVLERIRLRVESHDAKWHGALRVGFTNVPPDSRSLPLPKFAIPDLTDTSGHWAAALYKDFCLTGSVVEFWVTTAGSLYVSTRGGHRRKLLTGVCITKRLWAMIDVYGQTTSVLLLGSVIRGTFFTRMSCQHLPSPVFDTGSSTSDNGSRHDLPLITEGGEVMTCVVCMELEANRSLPCGHRCLCVACYHRVLGLFGTCPLCRKRITDTEMSADNFFMDSFFL
ncbi:E3 ubiquitin-protein ligase NEURL3 [Phyllopteryx taeniolatus]|uniref:E3 ubiquitin-protein ligase NEURL3 n=1 Tax=Phyllopteryx taeniolatus TaxID=161469 RepID=UPI002AD4AFFE|nr:E3 ubiquitin-protein ligase NEURL3 [Phyllopteryx taeniolatus]